MIAIHAHAWLFSTLLEFLQPLMDCRQLENKIKALGPRNLANHSPRRYQHMLKPQADLLSTARLSHTAQHVGPALNCRSLLVLLPTGWDSPDFSERCSWTASCDTQSGFDPPQGSAGAREASGVPSGETWLCCSSTGSLDITRGTGSSDGLLDYFLRMGVFRPSCWVLEQVPDPAPIALRQIRSNRCSVGSCLEILLTGVSGS